MFNKYLVLEFWLIFFLASSSLTRKVITKGFRIFYYFLNDIIIIIITSISSFTLRSDVISSKKCRNSKHQPVVLAIVAFFPLISYPTLSILFLLFQVNKASVMLQSSSLSLISLSISQSICYYC